MLAVQPQSPGLADRIWWGSGSRETAVWAGEQGMNLMSSTLLLEDTQVPFDQLQADQIELFREAWTKAGHAREPRVSVSRSVIPITSDLDRRLFGADTNEDQVGWLDGAISRFGRTYTGEPDRIAEELAARRGRPGRRHDPSHRPEPARRRLQRSDAQDDRLRHRTSHRMDPKGAARASRVAAADLPAAARVERDGCRSRGKPRHPGLPAGDERFAHLTSRTVRTSHHRGLQRAIRKKPRA